MNIFLIIKVIFRAIFANRSNLVAENLALRQQLAVLRRNTKRPKLRNSDRIFWAWLSRLWKGWRSTLLIVQPETVIKWTAKALSSIGDSNPEEDPDDQGLALRLENTSGKCRKIIPLGEFPGSNRN